MVALRAAAVLAGLIFCLPFHYLWKLFRARSIWPQLFLAYAARCIGLRVRVEGQPLLDNVLFAANHVTWLDILALGATTRAAFVSRDDVEDWPLVGWLAGLNDTIYVVRHARREVKEQADDVRAALAGGRAVTLFPEGTTDGGHETLPFRPSLFASLYPPLQGVRVQPVAIDYGSLAGEVAWIGEEGLGENAARVTKLRGGLPVILRFLAPIDPVAAGNRKALAAQVETAVRVALGASVRNGDGL